MSKSRPLAEAQLARIVQFWTTRLSRNLTILSFMMIAVSAIWLSYEFWRLLVQEPPWGAIDLTMRYHEILAWMGGERIYKTMDTAVYPPATYVLLWPFLGWSDVTPARFMWAASSVAAIIWLCRQTRYHTRASDGYVLFATLLPLCIYATGATIGNGQLGVHVLPAIIASCVLFTSESHSWKSDFLAAGLFVFALVKPSIAAPFFWLILFVPRRLRPAVLVCAGYALVSLLAASFQSEGVIDLWKEWLGKATNGVFFGSAEGARTGAPTPLNLIQHSEWSSYFSLIWFFCLGLWTFYIRKVDFWVIFGIAALVSRFWTYHMWYDDVLLLIPMIALFRTANSRSLIRTRSTMAGVLFAVLFLFSLAPGGLYLFPPPWNLFYVNVQFGVWVMTFVFLIGIAIRERRLISNRETSLISTS